MPVGRIVGDAEHVDAQRAGEARDRQIGVDDDHRLGTRRGVERVAGRGHADEPGERQRKENATVTHFVRDSPTSSFVFPA